MLNKQQIELLEPKTKVVQIICVALVLGVSMFAVVIAVVTNWGGVNRDLSLLTTFGLGMGGLLFLLSIFVPAIIGKGAAKTMLQQIESAGNKPDSDEGLQQLLGVFQTKTIIRFALLEGGAFLNLIVFFVDHSIISLAVTGGVIVCMMLAIPRNEQIYEWLSEQVNPRFSS